MKDLLSICAGRSKGPGVGVGVGYMIDNRKERSELNEQTEF